jgi:phosphomannomutase
MILAVKQGKIDGYLSETTYLTAAIWEGAEIEAVGEVIDRTNAGYIFQKTPQASSLRELLDAFICDSKEDGLLDKLQELYKEYGYCLNTLHSYEFDGSAGFAKMQKIMQDFRKDPGAFGGKRVETCLDYAEGLDGLPKSDVLKFLLADNCSVVVRPSGTEPKLKTYISITAENKEAAEELEARIDSDLKEFMA